MPRKITVEIETSDPDPERATVKISTGWEVMGTTTIFQTKKGPISYVSGGGGSGTTALNRPDNHRVAELRGFVPATVAANATGQGTNDESGSGIYWKVINVANLDG